MADVVTKAEFAKLVQRDPAFVSRAIASGKLVGDALVGEGRMARIRVAPALAQLGRALDLGQQLAQANPVLPDVGGDLVARAEGDGGDTSGIHAGRARQVELRNRKLEADLQQQELDLRRRAGELVPAGDVAAALRRQLGPLVSTFDEVPAVVAKAVADAHGVPYSEVLITIKGALRQQRAAWAERARALGAVAEQSAAA